MVKKVQNAREQNRSLTEYSLDLERQLKKGREHIVVKQMKIDDLNVKIKSNKGIEVITEESITELEHHIETLE